MFLHAAGGPMTPFPVTPDPGTGDLLWGWQCVHACIDVEGSCFPGSSLCSYSSPVLPSARIQKTAKIHSQSPTPEQLPFTGFIRGELWHSVTSGRKRQMEETFSIASGRQRVWVSIVSGPPCLTQSLTYTCAQHVTSEWMDTVYFLLLDEETWSSESWFLEKVPVPPCTERESGPSAKASKCRLFRLLWKMIN